MSDLPIFRCCLVGDGTLLIRCAEQLLTRGHTIETIISTHEAIVDWAQDHAVEVLAPDGDLAAALSQTPFDYLFSIANLQIIPADVLSLPHKAAINFHDGPLPRYAGLHATSWALLNQEPTHGVTWHEMGEKVDAGNILKQRLFDIAPDETAFTLNAKCYSAGVESFAELIDELAAGTVQPATQDPAEKTYFGKYQRPSAAQIIDWAQPAAAILALTRALDFGRYANPLGLPKLWIDGPVALVAQIEALDVPSSAPPGTVVALDDAFIQVATATEDVAIRGLLTPDGQPLPLGEFVTAASLQIGTSLNGLDSEAAGALSAFHESIVRQEAFWQDRLASLEVIAAPYAQREAAAGTVALDMSDTLAKLVGGGEVQAADVLAAAFALYLARVHGSYRYDLGWRVSVDAPAAGPLYASYVPLRVNVLPTGSVLAALTGVLDDLARIKKRRTYARDLLARAPELKALRDTGGVRYPVIVDYASSPADYRLPPGSDLVLLLTAEGMFLVSQGVNAEALAEAFLAFVENLARHLNEPLAGISLLSAKDLNRLFIQWNATDQPVPEDQCIYDPIEAQAAQHPDAVAVVFEDQSLTYGELNRRANQLARHLQALGVQPDTPVGIYLDRSLEMVVGLLGILKAGGAYVPLDPTYPEERIAFMLADAQVPVLVTQSPLVPQLPTHHAQVVCLDTDWAAIATQADGDFDSGVRPHHLSYVIYTSGSTGKPKGVMIEHRNVINFFVGMDQHVQHDPAGVWLAVTSLSFDISVLELFWTLARGFKVVLYADAVRGAAEALHHVDRPIDFSLYYFASDEGESAGDKYELLVEGAKFADQHGFYAVWTPERHFHAFGGLYPNPSVASAALAMVTQRVKILAGSCVLPLHSPIRVAEEWALVDNLSKGRVGISFAAGWQPNDFVLMPGNFADRKNIMFRDIETVRRLWRGETVELPGPQGKPVAVRTLPRPIQVDLPVWVTAAGNPETFREAGAQGFYMLTHLLGQSTEELAEKIAIYRQAWRDGGYPGEGHVTLMLHTFVGDDDDAVREIVREPMKTYLRSSVDLIKKAAWSFPAFKQRAEATGQSPLEIFESDDLTDDDMDALLDHAFERYFETSGLFGTVETCLRVTDGLKGIGVDEIACLIDYGVDKQTMLAQLEPLNRVREQANAIPEGDFSFAGQTRRHGVTHLQCTPSMAGMLLEGEANRAALGRLQQILIGGEAFPAALAKTLRTIVSGSILNMYGPTETTVWSSVHRLNGAEESIPIGRPIANTVIYILDSQLQPVPAGVPGELFIGGKGVVRGYLNRPELTSERFIADPFSKEPGARLYRTGDLARYLPDGVLEFMGRIDHQVKIRGHRIELGEIEALLDTHPTVSQSVVIAREDVPGDKRLVAYVIPASNAEVCVPDLRSNLRAQLPDFMVPAQVVRLDSFPLTPNAKIDRKALPAPETVNAPQTEAAYVAPQGDLEAQIAAIWQEVLGLQRVGTGDNFFDLGGHSLLAVRLHRQICDRFDRQIPITDIFRFPTIQALALHLGGDQEEPEPASGLHRAASRREAMQRRLQRRPR